MLVCVSALLATAPAQDQAPLERLPSIRSDVRLVLVPVMVTDRRGATLTGLVQEHFKLFEERTPQTIASFKEEDAPCSIGIVFDVSGSMEGTLPDAVTKLIIENGMLPRFRANDFAGGIACRTHHRLAARCVHVQHSRAQAGSGSDRSGNGIGDVMIFEIKEYAAAGIYQVANDCRPLSRIELHADLVGMGGVSNGRHNLPGGRRRRHIQGNDEALTRIHFHRCRVYLLLAGIG